MSVADFFVNFKIVLPLTVLALWACVLLLIDLFIPKERKGIVGLLAGVGLLVTLVIVILGADQEPQSAFGGMVMVDGFTNFLNVLILLSGLFAVALAHDYLKRTGLERGEYYVLLLFSITGMTLMAMATDLIVIFLALELLSIPLYILAGFALPRPDSEEAAMKYFLLGAFSSGIFVYGVALVFGATGTTSLTGIIEAVSQGSLNPTGLVVGAALVLIGFGFKVAVVPFHMWTPDVYHGAPTSVTAFMSVAVKAAGFAALLRVFVLAFPSLASDLTPVFWAVAALTMILGNVVAIVQSNIKRMLAYSSIAHAGYIMMVLVTYGQDGVSQNAVASALFYLVAYMFTSFAAWAVVIALEQAEGRGLLLDDYAGLSRKYPLLAVVMTVAMLSFIGVPPTLGFVGKFTLFLTVIEGGFVGLAIVGVITSLISAYYYLRVVVIMYMRDGEPEVRREGWLLTTAVISGVVTLVLGIFSEPLFTLVSQAILQLF